MSGACLLLCPYHFTVLGVTPSGGWLISAQSPPPHPHPLHHHHHYLWDLLNLSIQPTPRVTSSAGFGESSMLIGRWITRTRPRLWRNLQDAQPSPQLSLSSNRSMCITAGQLISFQSHMRAVFSAFTYLSSVVSCVASL